jgi:hypothetical protein
MVSVDWRNQILLLAIFTVAYFVLRRKASVQGLRLVRWLTDYYEDIFQLLNIAGLFTTNLLSMSNIHAIKLLFLACLYIQDGFERYLSLAEWWHHILGTAGVILQLHIGLGGGMMSFLLLDSLTWYFEGTRLFWPLFVLIRIVMYNFVLCIAVFQGRKVYATSPSVELKFWLITVVIWWVFSIVYHAEWIWKEHATLLLRRLDV